MDITFENIHSFHNFLYRRRFRRRNNNTFRQMTKVISNNLPLTSNS